MARPKLPLEKVTIRLDIGVKEEINSFYPNLGYNKVIRKLVNTHLKKLREKLDQRSLNHDPIDDDNIQLSVD